MNSPVANSDLSGRETGQKQPGLPFLRAWIAVSVEMDRWLGVELRHLATLAAIHEERSFRAAAQRLGYVQSAISQQITSLEAMVGTRLVERSRGQAGVKLTDAGRALLHHADRIVSQLYAAQADLGALEDGERRALRVGVEQSLAARLLPRTLTALAESAPELRLQTREELCDGDLFKPVERGELDVGFAELPLEPGPFECRELLVDPLVLLVAATSPLARQPRPPQLAEIAAEPFVNDPAWRMFELVEAEFSAAGCDLDLRFGVRTNAAVQALVGAGLGVAVMPRLAVDLADPATVAIPFDHRMPARTVVCFWHRERLLGAGLELLFEAAAAACPELSPPGEAEPPSLAAGNASASAG